MIFDDSWEHEARFPTPTLEGLSERGANRYVLYTSIWHPDLGPPTLPKKRRWPAGGRKGRKKKKAKPEL